MKITAKELKYISSKANAQVVADLEKYLVPALLKYEINTPRRVSQFLAQAAHESDGFKTLQEYASGAAYEGRKDLGNVHKGDGKKFKGRGIFQLTGRANYTEMSKKLGVDLVEKPELAATGEISVLTACEYWKSRHLNKHADENDIRRITKRINGGYNGFEDRKAYFEKVMDIINDIFDSNVVVTPKSSGLVILRRGDHNESVRIVQAIFNQQYPTVKVDGHFGPVTEWAVKEFQKNNNLPVNGVVDTETYKAITKSK